jgi:putative exporter of polyketide antibiotics
VHIGLPTMLGAGLNVVPTALVALGVGAVVLSVAPRAAARSVYSVVIWSLLVDLVASLISGLKWLEHVSVFHYMALAPAQDPEPRTLALTLVLALALCGVATMLFDRRDVR